MFPTIGDILSILYVLPILLLIIGEYILIKYEIGMQHKRVYDSHMSWFGMWMHWNFCDQMDFTSFISPEIYQGQSKVWWFYRTNSHFSITWNSGINYIYIYYISYFIEIFATWIFGSLILTFA